MEKSQTPNQSKSAVLLVTALGAFITPFMASSVNIALPSIGRQFSLNAIHLSWIATSYLLSAAVFLVPFGRLADIYGRKKIFLIGTVVSIVAAGLCGLAPNAPTLIVFRILHGAGVSMLFGTGIAIVSSVFPPKERGKAIGLNVGAVYLGLTLGPPIGGFLIKIFGWRSIFYINIPLGLLIIVLILWKIKGDWALLHRERFDIAGSLLYGIGLVNLIYGFSHLPELHGILLTITGITILGIFIFFESRTPFPVLHVGLFKHNQVFLFSNLAAMINYSATFASGFLLSLYLQYIKGLPPDTAGLILIAQPLVMAIFSPFAGRLSDKIEPRIEASVGMALTAISLAFFVPINGQTSYLQLISGLIVLGFGLALFSSPNTNAIMGSVEKRFLGIASATQGTMRLLGQMFSMGISMMVFAVTIGKTEVTTSNHALFLKGVQTTFLIFILLCIIGIWASLKRGTLRKLQ